MMSKFTMALSLMVGALLMAPMANAQDANASSSAPQPNTFAQPLRLIPVVGASSMTTSTTVQNNRFNESTSLGLFADFGQTMWNFETGVLTLTSHVNKSEDAAGVSVDTWGIPLLAKLNLSGKPHETVFLKAGIMPFKATGDNQDFNVMGVAGIGADIPLGHNSSLVLDAAYNRLFNNNGSLTNYQGISLLGGLSFNI